MYWESNKESTCHIDGGGRASILVSGISSETDKVRNLFQGGLMLYRMGTSGEQVFGAATLESAQPRFLANGKAYSLADKCDIEVEITSSPELAEVFGPQRYALKLDHTCGEKLLFTPVLAPDSGCSQTE